MKRHITTLTNGKMVVLKTRSQAKNFAKRMKKHYKKLDVPHKDHVSENNYVFIDYNKKRVIHLHALHVGSCRSKYTAKVIGVLK